MRAFLLVVLAGCSFTAAAEFKGVGRDATDAEVKAWDIDVRPDFQGLPPGSGKVSDGETLWIAKCSSCHGDFGDANHVFVPLVGNTTAEDIKTGRVASLKAGGSVRTTFTKVATVSTLWDYIHRAMPWDAPKSLSHDEVYALLAYLLNLAEIVPADYVLSDKNVAEVQARMPNRNGMTHEHGLWDLKGKPDTHNLACVKDCKKDVVVLSELPVYARNAHGNLADQNRSYGAVRGVVTASAVEAPKPAASSAPAVTAVLGSKGCTGCHGMDKRIIGPGFDEIAAKYGDKDQKEAKAHLTTRIKAGGSGIWGPVPMPPQPAITEAELNTVVDWLLAGAAP